MIGLRTLEVFANLSTWKIPNIVAANSGDETVAPQDAQEVPLAAANCYGSRLKDNPFTHSFLLDLDYPCFMNAKAGHNEVYFAVPSSKLRLEFLSLVSKALTEEQMFPETGVLAHSVAYDVGNSVITIVFRDNIVLLPSRTPYHFHLYCFTELSWSAYQALLVIMALAGMVQVGFVRSAINQECALLRMPDHMFRAAASHDEKTGAFSPYPPELPVQQDHLTSAVLSGFGIHNPHLNPWLSQLLPFEGVEDLPSF